MSIRRIGSGTIWETRVGYSRAVVANGFVFISSSAALDDAGNVVGSDMYEQVRYILQRLGEVLRDAGSSLDRVVQTRLYVIDASRWEEVGRAHHEVFGDHPPAMSFVHVKPFVHPDMLVEIELTATAHDYS